MTTYILKIVALIITGIIGTAIFILVMSRTTEEAVTDHPLIGQTFSPGDTVYYYGALQQSS